MKEKRKMKERDLFKLLSLIAVGVCMIIVLNGCARPGHQKGDTYKILLGTKCADNGTVQSPIWFHTTLGPKQVAKDKCAK